MGKGKNKGNTNIGSGTQYAICRHEGDKVLFNVHGVDVRAASVYDLDESISATILDCTGSTKYSGSVDEDPVLDVPEGYEDLLDYMVVQQTIMVDWRDGGVPALYPDFWDVLPQVVANNEMDTLIVACIGSHGRTGTALAAMLIADGMNLIEAVEYVRKQHCDEAVETYPQLDYLEKVEQWFSDRIKNPRKKKHRLPTPSRHYRGKYKADNWGNQKESDKFPKSGVFTDKNGVQWHVDKAGSVTPAMNGDVKIEDCDPDNQHIADDYRADDNMDDWDSTDYLNVGMK